MIEHYCNFSDHAFYKIISHEEILKSALENLKYKNGSYYTLIKDYIFNYEKIDKGALKKIKNVIISVQNCARKYGEKKTIEKLINCLNTFDSIKDKNLYKKLHSICAKYKETDIVENIINCL